VTSTLLELAERIIKKAEREHPADSVLRQQLKEQRGLSPKDAAAITHAVFAYYRWRGWSRQQGSLRDQIRQGMEMADHYAREPQKFPDEELIECSVPAWVRSEMPVSGAWVRALQSEPKLWLRARPGKGTPLAKRLRHTRRPSGTPGETIEYVGRDDLFRTPEFHAGEFEVQDLNSQVVGLICAPIAGETWWDACAGEGGKLLHLSDLMQNRGLIWASDRAEWRLQRLKRRAARAKVFNYRVAPWDGGAKLPTKTRFEGVLVDAPCSGVGTWHRNPHARWTTTPEDVQELADLQKLLLAHASASVKPRGKLIYAVCTLTHSETTAVADAFEKAFGDFRPLLILNPLTQASVKSGRLQLWPQDYGGNGMFIAAWLRC
jgi:16S rRNA (cytosine967-C5)-methyltransferase